jgi:predicted glycogen debranching enzyme
MTETKDLTRTLTSPRDALPEEPMPRREWLVTNGLGGYASGTVAGVVTRRYHGLLVAALPVPLGRVVMLNHLLERVRIRGGEPLWLGDEDEVAGPNAADRTGHLAEFVLELGLPVWRYRLGGVEIEKRVIMPHRQNTVHITYRLLSGQGPVRLTLRPSVHFRFYEAPVDSSSSLQYFLTASRDGYELTSDGDFPPLRMNIHGPGAALTLEARGRSDVPYEMEARRGYDSVGALWSPGYFRADLEVGHPVTLVASTESWEQIRAIAPDEALIAETERRRRLLDIAGSAVKSDFGAELVLAADQFIITPAGRVEDAARWLSARKSGRSSPGITGSPTGAATR